MKTTKHNHKGTNKLKVCLLSLFLLMPFICFIPTAFYYGFNEHAQAQEHTEQVPQYYQSNEINSINDLVVGNIYELNYTTGDTTLSDCILMVEKFIIIEGSYTGAGDQGTTYAVTPYIQFSNNNYIYTYETINNVVYTKYFSFLKCVFIFSQVNNNNLPISLINETDYQLLSGYLEETYTMSITDSMSTAWTNTWSNPLFSWVNNNPLKSNIDGFVNWFGITDNAVIPQYLTYIVSIVGIYIVIDIILVLFTHLTHMFSKEQN